MNRTEKNGILLLLTLCVFLLPAYIHAQTPSDGETAAQKIERIREEEDQQKATEECNNAAQSAVSPNGGGGGDYVPVHEIGDLLNVSTQNAGLTFQICMYTRALKRIQYEWEDKEFITNPDARKASAKAINDLRQEYFYGDTNNSSDPGIARKQFYTSQQEEQAQAGQPIYITNTDQRIKSVNNEAEGLFLYDLSQKAQQQPLFTQSIKSAIAQDSAINQNDSVRLTQRLTSDFTSQQAFDDFTNDFNNGGWDAWLKIIQPNNNPYGQYMIAQEELGLRKSKAEQNAREEILAGGGFLPNRKCIANGWVGEPNSSVQFCKQWETLTPALAQANQYNQIWGATLNQAINADQQTEDFIKNELPVDQAHLVSGIGAQNPTNIPESIFDKPDPCPGPEPCPDTGWNGTGSNLPGGGAGTGNTGGNTNTYQDNDGNGIPDYLDSNPNAYLGLQELLGTLLGLTNQQRQQRIRDFLSTHAPIVTMTATVPSLADITSGTLPNTSRITWTAYNATECHATNDWYTRGTRPSGNLVDGSYTVAKEGDPLNITNRNFVNIEHPVRFPIDFVYTTFSYNPSDFNYATTRGMISTANDYNQLIESVQINIQAKPGFNASAPYDLLLGRLDGRWDPLTNSPNGDNAAIHIPAQAPNVCSPGQTFGPNKLVAALRNEIIRRQGIAGDPAQNTLRFFSLFFNTNDSCSSFSTNTTESASISITPILTYKMICTNTNLTNNTTPAEITLTRP